MTELADESAFEVARHGICDPDLALARNLVQVLDYGRLVALGLAADLYNGRGLALSRDLGDVIGNARALAHDLTEARALARRIFSDRDLNDRINTAWACACKVADDLTGARDRDRATRGTSIDLTLSLDRALAGTRAYAEARDQARMTSRDLAAALTVARNRARDLANDFADAFPAASIRVDATAERDAPERPARPAVTVAWTATVLLARQDRPRYDLEYRSELADMAATGTGRGQQLRYAARLLVRTPLLRAELARTRRRQAVR